MGYYNIFVILKNILYNFRRIFKYICISLLALCFIAICLLLMSTKGECAEYTEDYSSTIKLKFSVDDTILSRFNSTQYADGSYLYLIMSRFVSFQGWYCDIYAVPRSTGATTLGVYNYSNNTWTSNSTITDWYKTSFATSSIPSTITLSHYTTAFNISSAPRRTDTNFSDPSYVIANIPVWTTYDSMIFDINGDNQRFHFPNEPLPPFNEPVFVNAEDSNWGNTLVNGEFNYFFIDENDADIVSFEVRDLTLINQNYNIDIDSWSQTFYLWELPQYLYNEQTKQYAIPKTDLVNGYYNNHTYQFVLSWQSDDDTYSKDWTITTDFSQATIINNEEQQKNKMEQDISSINNFLTDDSYNSSTITDQMPSTNLPDPTEFQVDNIFNMFREAFTTTNAQDIVIPLPHTDNKIIIPADLVTSKIPNTILILIQGFYWFLICRYIVKDISKIVERAKSGEILDAQDGNIKTDLF